MPRPRLPAAWLPHSLRTQFLLAIAALMLLILAGGVTAVQALHSAARTSQQLTTERLEQLHTAQELVRRTLFIERATSQLADATTLEQIRHHYADILVLLEESDSLTDRLASDVGDSALLDLHQASQMFRNSVHVAVQLLERTMHNMDHGEAAAGNTAMTHRTYLNDLHVHADDLLRAALSQSEYFTLRHHQAMQQMDIVTQRHAHVITVLLVASLLLAAAVAWWFLGHHVLGRLLQVSRSLRMGDEEATQLDVPLLRDQQQASDEIGEMAHAAALFREDRRQLQLRTEELRLARDAAEAANKAKSVFLANMSHELRTPLNAILGFSQMMAQEPGLTAAQAESLKIINNSGEHLLKLINDVLELAKIEANKLQLEVSSFDLHGMTRDVIDMMQVRAQQKGLQLTLEQSPLLPRYIKGDEARLRQILNNLIGNAIKFTDHGVVTVRLGNKGNGPSHLILEVEDTGTGITAQEQLQLFKPFTQLSEGAARGGTGLGLSIVHQFVQLMKGNMTVESVPGKGTLFRVELPLELGVEADTTSLRRMSAGEVAGLAPGQPAYRILIAEDHPDNRVLLSRLMTRLGLTVKTAENGAECVAVFEDWHPDLIWMDRRMPVMEGLEATQRIRGLPGGDQVKIIAVTASAFMEEERSLRDAGVDDYVRKPYLFGEIYNCLERHLGLRLIYRSDGEPADAATPARLSPQHLAALSPSLRTELHDAVESLDRTRIDAVIERIGAVDAELGAAVSHLAAEFDYPSILDALHATAGATPTDTL